MSPSALVSAASTTSGCRCRCSRGRSRGFQGLSWRLPFGVCFGLMLQAQAGYPDWPGSGGSSASSRPLASDVGVNDRDPGRPVDRLPIAVRRRDPCRWSARLTTGIAAAPACSTRAAPRLSRGLAFSVSSCSLAHPCMHLLTTCTSSVDHKLSRSSRMSPNPNVQHQGRDRRGDRPGRGRRRDPVCDQRLPPHAKRSHRMAAPVAPISKVN